MKFNCQKENGLKYPKNNKSSTLPCTRDNLKTIKLSNLVQAWSLIINTRFRIQ